jgi:hypothetical protein
VPSTDEDDSRWRMLPVVGQCVAVLAWLWPIGLGGRMPVGGDVTQFSIGLMAVLRRSLRAGHLPLWNDLWGYGFPGVGESQMGVYYPPHWVLYGFLPLETAYTASLVLHTLWGTLGAYWAARIFGVSRTGAALAGFAWSTCGFFLIHLSHQWGYTTGSWMPWVWGLSWASLKADGPRRAACCLALAMALQLLPGHFQLAFCTQVGVVVLAIEQGIERWVTRSRGLARVGTTFAALGGAFLLAALQLWPTWRLARLAAPRRDFEYLSGFAATPLHLVTFVAPGLFERSPLWRPLVWEPFHTSPEEYLGYVGIVPLFLAIGAIAGGIRVSAVVRALTVVAGVALILALGPFVPGFEVLCSLPGFSFFRAPARWLLPVSLALCLLAGVGFDRIPQWRNLRKAALRFCLGAAAVVALVVVLVEVAVLGGSRSGWPAVDGVYGRAFEALPWHEKGLFRRVMADARRPNLDFRVDESLARQGIVVREAPRPVFVEQRYAIYRRELADSLLILAGLAALATISRRPKWFGIGLIVLTVIDLESQARYRRVDFGPLASLITQSPVLARLDREPHGTRTIDTVRNLPMVAGVAPVSAYRTLDLPAVDSLTALACQIPRRPGDDVVINSAMRSTGASLRVYEPTELLEIDRGRKHYSADSSAELINDPALAGWRFGVDWVAQQTDPRATTFRVSKVDGGGVEAWQIPLTRAKREAILGRWSGHPSVVLDAMADARPLSFSRADPEHCRVKVSVEGPAIVVISQLADPQWRATWSGTGGESPATIHRAFGKPGQGAWQAVEVPGSGDWELKVDYRGDDVWQGLLVSAVALVGWVVLWIRGGIP